MIQRETSGLRPLAFASSGTPFWPASVSWMRLCPLALLLAMVFASRAVMFPQNASPNPSERSSIRGVVRDSAGKPVSDGLVRLERKGTASFAEARTSALGVFEFQDVRTGSYTVSAQNAGLKSAPATVVSSSSRDRIHVDLVLENPSLGAARQPPAAEPSTQAMEFADEPKFTIAGVTDWTAAGGHGSDAVLRTSEAITHEALTVGSKNEAAAVPSSTQGAKADLHRMAGEIEEERGDPVTAVREFELATRLDPSERNTFEWGSELLRHRAIWQSRDVFTKGAKDYPKSQRMMTALGAALFAGALYEEAALRLCDASDLNPLDREPYLLMGKVVVAASDPVPCVNQRLARFVEQKPEDSLANYFDAMVIWKQRRASLDATTVHQISALLAKAVALDAKCGEALLQLGNLSFSQHEYQDAIVFYTRAVATQPELIEAHYRLGTAYDRVGEKAKASQEFQLHDELKKLQAADVERQRREVKQFVVVGSDPPPEPAPR